MAHEIEGLATVGGDDRKAMKSTKRLTPFLAADASPCHLPTEGLTETDIAHISELSTNGLGADGFKSWFLFQDPAGMSLLRVWFKSGYVLPRHSHHSDCLYYILAGEVRMGNQVLKKGDGFLVPSDAAYTYDVGPDGVEVLEFRSSPDFNLVYRNNDNAHWSRIVQAFDQGASRWADEPAPSGIAVPAS